ncbi:alpha-glucan family phosphorylase [Patescibacteria group bacterium]|nr:alpha-glucan family phosphorylase [Patescibacteria group bacterium]
MLPLPWVEDYMLDIAYFSMEVALEAGMHTYSGGLGVLAGDTLKTFADFGFAAVGITLLNELGYVEQGIDSTGRQVSRPELWNKEEYLTKLPFTIEVPFKGRAVACAVWQYIVVGQFEKEVPVYFLDTHLPGNNKYDRTLTSHLYGGDAYYRLCQEQILGLGGFILLDKLGFGQEKVRIYHLNEGHAAFVGLSLYSQGRESHLADEAAIDLVHSKVVFTTHTPVMSGHDQFSSSDVGKTLPTKLFNFLPEEAFQNNQLCMTRLALYYSGIVTGVARSHEKTAEKMFPGYDVVSVTNGVYHLAWTHPNFKSLYDKYIPLWRRDPAFLHAVLGIPDDEIWAAHRSAKQELIEHVNQTSSVKLALDVCTLGFARRVTVYKRPTLILTDLKKLEKIAAEVGPLQIIFAGEAHPYDRQAIELIRQIFQKTQQFKGNVKIAFLEDYGMGLATKLTAGVDVWLNTPRRTYEASGTSGMKAALNAVPHLSVLDGWWPEGWVEGVTGWSIGSQIMRTELDDQTGWGLDVLDLYYKLAVEILPLYYKDRTGFVRIMKCAAALNGSRFNTNRMVRDYVSKVYFPLKTKISANTLGVSVNDPLK